MNVFRLLAVSLIVAGCVGCGNEPKPPAAVAPPPFKPASDRLTEQDATDNAGTAEPAGAAEEDTLATDESPVETAANEEMDDEADLASTPDSEGDTDETEPPGSVASDSSDDDGPAETSEVGVSDPVSDSEAEKPVKAKSGKWMRGLTNSLNRAVSKTLEKAAQPTTDAAKSPAPEDDPFPNGEPEDEKPDEKEPEE